MKRGRYRKAVFVVVYSMNKNKIEYLILKRKHHWIGWEFPKGGLGLFETERHTAKREIREETGLRLIQLNRFNIHGRYKYPGEFSDRRGIIGQTFSLYSAEVEKGKVRIDKREHSDYKWFSFSEAMKKLTWDNQKKCLKIVNDWLKSK